MFIYLSKFLPLFVYPAGLTCLLLVLALVLRRHPQWQTRLIAVALAVLWLGGNRVVTMALVRSLEWRYVPPPDAYQDVPHADAIVVLGGGSRSQQYQLCTRGHCVCDGFRRQRGPARARHVGGGRRALRRGCRAHHREFGP